MLLLAAALANPLPEVLPPDTTLLGVEEGSEFVRYHLAVEERDFYIEVTPTSRGGAVCEGGGNELWVRLSLESSESFEWEPLPEVVDLTCERLTRTRYGAQPVVEEDTASPAQPTATDGWLLPIAIGWLLLLLWHLRGRETAALFAGALATRVMVSPHTVALPGAAAYEQLLVGGGELAGPGSWPVLMQLGLGHVHWTNLVLSALAVPLLYRVLERLSDRTSATAGALLMILMPLPILLAATEVDSVAVATLQLAAVAGALQRRRVGNLFAVLSSILLVFISTLHAVFLLLPLGLLAMRKRPAAVAIASALLFCLWDRTLDVDTGALWALSWQAMVPGPGALDRVLDPLVTPVMVPLMGLGGVLAAMNRERWRAALVPCFGALFTIFLVLDGPAHAHLPVQSWWVALAGLGLGAVVRWGRLPAMAMWAAFGASLFFARDPLPTTAWMEEYRLLHELHPEGSFYNADQDPQRFMSRWAGLHPASAPLVAGDRMWRGAADAEAGWGRDHCDWMELSLHDTTAETGGLQDLGTDSLLMGLYEAKDECERR